jgi:hypothetical protein
MTSLESASHATVCYMEFSSHSRRSALPRTVVGRWLRAALLHDTELRRQLQKMLNEGKRGWNDDEPAVVEAACELIAGQYFGVSHDVRDITEVVTEMRAQMKDKEQLDHLKAEALIRAALGEADVSVTDISTKEKFYAGSLVVGFLAAQLELDEAGIGRLVREAERIAFDRGWHPPLARRT